MSVRVILAGVGLNGQTLPESFTFTTNNEDPVISIDPGSCADWTIDGNTVTSPDVVDGLNGIALVYSKTGFTTLTITSSEGNNINGGSFIGFCDTSMIPAPIVGVEERGWNENVQLFPNPSDGHITLKLGEQNSNLHLDIRDVMGREVYIEKVDQQQVIELDLDLSPGSYILRIQDGKATWTSKLIIK